jgi:hypothetical protein
VASRAGGASKFAPKIAASFSQLTREFAAGKQQQLQQHWPSVTGPPYLCTRSVLAALMVFAVCFQALPSMDAGPRALYQALQELAAQLSTPQTASGTSNV